MVWQRPVGGNFQVRGQQGASIDPNAAGENLPGHHGFVPDFQALMGGHIAGQLAVDNDDGGFKRAFEMTRRLDEDQTIRFHRPFQVSGNGEGAREGKTAFQLAFGADEAALAGAAFASGVVGVRFSHRPYFPMS